MNNSGVLYRCRKCNKCFPEKEKYLEHFQKVHELFKSDREVGKGKMRSVKMKNEDKVIATAFSLEKSEETCSEESGDDCHLDEDDRESIFPNPSRSRERGKNYGGYVEPASSDSDIESDGDDTRDSDSDFDVQKEKYDKLPRKRSNSMTPLFLKCLDHKCQLCDAKNFTTATQFARHLKNKHGKVKKPIKCPLCFKGFTVYTHFMVHVPLHFSNKNYSTSSTFENYANSSKCNLKFECKVCKVTFNSYPEIEDHILPHKCLKCEKCAKEFYEVSSKANHLDETKQYKCDICREEIFGECNLHKHERDHFGNFSETGTCPKCLKACSKISIRGHLKKHYFGTARTIERAKGGCTVRRKLSMDEYKCEFCNKKVPTFARLNDHVRRHLGEKILKCDKCEYRCCSLADIRKHRNIHKKEKSFVCPQCSKAFSFLDNMRRHVRSAHNTTKIKCPKCPKTFSEKSYLKDHLQSHIKEKTFKCKYCDKVYQHRSNMYRHIREQHKK